MITQLSRVRLRLNFAETDTQHDNLLVQAIQAIGATFERRCRRALLRVPNALHEFYGDETELRVACYPVEAVHQFELKSNEVEGWVLQDPPRYVVRQECVISLRTSLGTETDQARVVYTGGYVEPGTPAQPGQTPLPSDLEHAAIEQVAGWFYNREKIGLLRNWPSSGTFQQFTQLPLLPSVEELLRRYERMGF